MCNGDAWGPQDTRITPVKTVEFVEFLVLTLVLWVVLVGDQDTETVCLIVYNGRDKHPRLADIICSLLLKHGVTVVVH